jgi:DNA-binding LacI/PurR family transcriptional regulator
MGELAVDFLLDTLAGRTPSGPRRRYLPCPLVTRESAGPPR